MSCQPHRVTSGQSNSGQKQIHISKLFSHINPLSSQITNIKHTYTNIRHSIKLNIYPERRPGMSEVPHPLSGISGLSFDSPFLSPLLFFCAVLMLFLSCPFSCFKKKESSQTFLVKSLTFLYGSC